MSAEQPAIYQLQEGENPFVWFNEHLDDKSVKLPDGSVMSRPSKTKIAAELKKLAPAASGAVNTPEDSSGRGDSLSGASDGTSPNVAAPHSADPVDDAPATAGTPSDQNGQAPDEAEENETSSSSSTLDGTPGNIVTAELIATPSDDVRALVMATLIAGRIKTLPYPRSEKEIDFLIESVAPLTDAIMEANEATVEEAE